MYAADLNPTDKAIIQEEEDTLFALKKGIADASQFAAEHDLIEQIIALRNSLEEVNEDEIPQVSDQIQRLTGILNAKQQLRSDTFDLSAPYFGRMRIEEERGHRVRVRDLLLGNTVQSIKIELDTSNSSKKTGSSQKIQIIDWRSSPISIVYFRGVEQEEYEEEYADQTFFGRLLCKRSFAFRDGDLVGIHTKEWRYTRKSAADPWQKQAAWGVYALKHETSGAQAATEADQNPIFGCGEAQQAEVSIEALLDAEQFDLISEESDSIITIQGGAGSGKTTVGMHRMAWLHHRNPRRFASAKISATVSNRALSRYISKALNHLGIQNTPCHVLEGFLRKLRRAAYGSQFSPALDSSRPITPALVVRLKRHPLFFRFMQAFLQERRQAFMQDWQAVQNKIAPDSPLKIDFPEREFLAPLVGLWSELQQAQTQKTGTTADALALMQCIECHCSNPAEPQQTLFEWWLEAYSRFTDLAAFFQQQGSPFSEAQMGEALDWLKQQYIAFIGAQQQAEGSKQEPSEHALPFLDGVAGSTEGKISPFLDGVAGSTEGKISPFLDGVAGSTEGKISPFLDEEDEPILLFFMTECLSPLHLRGKRVAYSHMFIDEVQDLSLPELHILLSMAAHTPAEEQQVYQARPTRAAVEGPNVSLAGDFNQDIASNTGINSWSQLLHEAQITALSTQPLQVNYRSSFPIAQLSNAILSAKLSSDSASAAGNTSPTAPAALAARGGGAPVELFHSQHQGSILEFLSLQLQQVACREPQASIAVICPEASSAQEHHHHLQSFGAEEVRLVADQDFSFTPGIDITDLSQVKGLEFDYVILTEVDALHYPAQSLHRRRLYVACTRARHQLWLVHQKKVSPLIPVGLVAHTRQL